MLEQWQLKRISQDPPTIVNSVSIIPLLNDGAVSVGRGPQAQYYMDSDETPRLISRLHATISGETRKDGVNFTVVNFGLNGTYINDVKMGIHSNNSHIIKEGDRITFGHVACGSIQCGEYKPQPQSEFQFVLEKIIVPDPSFESMHRVISPVPLPDSVSPLTKNIVEYTVVVNGNKESNRTKENTVSSTTDIVMTPKQQRPPSTGFLPLTPEHKSDFKEVEYVGQQPACYPDRIIIKSEPESDSEDVVEVKRCLFEVKTSKDVIDLDPPENVLDQDKSVMDSYVVGSAYISRSNNENMPLNLISDQVNHIKHGDHAFLANSPCNEFKTPEKENVIHENTVTSSYNESIPSKGKLCSNSIHLQTEAQANPSVYFPYSSRNTQFSNICLDSVHHKNIKSQFENLCSRSQHRNKVETRNENSCPRSPHQKNIESRVQIPCSIPSHNKNIETRSENTYLNSPHQKKIETSKKSGKVASTFKDCFSNNPKSQETLLEKNIFENTENATKSLEVYKDAVGFDVNATPTEEWFPMIDLSDSEDEEKFDGSYSTESTPNKDTSCRPNELPIEKYITTDNQSRRNSVFKNKSRPESLVQKENRIRSTISRDSLSDLDDNYSLSKGASKVVSSVNVSRKSVTVAANDPKKEKKVSSQKSEKPEKRRREIKSDEEFSDGDLLKNQSHRKGSSRKRNAAQVDNKEPATKKRRPDKPEREKKKNTRKTGSRKKYFDWSSDESDKNEEDDQWLLPTGVEYCNSECGARPCIDPKGKEVNWVQCDRCEKWYHVVCVDVPAHVLESESAEYICDYC